MTLFDILGRLLQIVPIVTVSTIQSVQGGVQNVVHPVDFQASAPSNLYTGNFLYSFNRECWLCG